MNQLIRTTPTMLIAIATSCAEVAGPSPKPSLMAHNFIVDTENFEVACVPTGMELCFDALDNNCNGLIDEGCGLHSGPIQFTIAWNAPLADVDLDVYDPSGKRAIAGEPTTIGLIKDRDCPKTDGTCYGQNVENVYLSEDTPPPGRYRAVVRLDSANGEPIPIKVRISARIGQRSFTAMFLLSPGQGTEEKAFSFEI